MFNYNISYDEKVENIINDLENGVDIKLSVENSIDKLKQYQWDSRAINHYLYHCAKFLQNDFSKSQFNNFINQVFLVGSPLFLLMFEVSSKSTIEKVNFVIDLMGGVIENNHLILKNKTFNNLNSLNFDSSLYPDCQFFEVFAKNVVAAYVKNLRLRDSNQYPFIRIHQFRYYIDKCNIEFIRNNFKFGNITDQEALSLYTTKYNLVPYKGSVSNARFHQRGWLLNERFAFNEKWMNKNGYVEFIIDIDGNFVGMWNVLKVARNGELVFAIDGVEVLLKNLPNDYDEVVNVLKEEFNIDDSKIVMAFSQIANTNSFNYAGHYNKKNTIKGIFDNSYNIHAAIDMISYKLKLDFGIRMVICDPSKVYFKSTSRCELKSVRSRINA